MSRTVEQEFTDSLQELETFTKSSPVHDEPGEMDMNEVTVDKLQEYFLHLARVVVAIAKKVGVQVADLPVEDSAEPKALLRKAMAASAAGKIDLAMVSEVEHCVNRGEELSPLTKAALDRV